MLRHNIRSNKNPNIFFEVPNALQIFQRLFIWDILYEHCSYFIPYSLENIFTLCGFRITKLTENYKSQYLCIEAKKINQNKSDNFKNYYNKEIDITQIIKDFYIKYQNKIEKYNKILNKMKNKQKRTVVWGAGSKGVVFLNIFKNLNLEYVVDINPNKQGKYVAGTGQEIVAPEFLKIYKPELIIIMNPIYKKEITKIINKMKLKTNILLG